MTAMTTKIHTIAVTQHLINSKNIIEARTAAPNAPRSIGQPLESSKAQAVINLELKYSLTEKLLNYRSGKQ